MDEKSRSKSAVEEICSFGLVRDRSLFSGGGGGGEGGGRAANFGGSVTIFWTQIWGGPLFFNLDLGEGY